MNREEGTIRDILRAALKTPGRGECPGEIQLALYAEGALEDKAAIEEHLFRCTDCLDTLILYEEGRALSEDQPLPDVPGQWMEKAIGLPAGEAGRAGFFDAVLKVTGEIITVLRKAGGLAVSRMPQPEPLRGGRAEGKELVTLRKSFPGLAAEVEVAKRGRDRVDLRVTVESPRHEAAGGGLRVSLHNPVREIASYVAEDGTVSFSGLPFGEYVIKIMRDRKPAGELSLEVKE